MATRTATRPARTRKKAKPEPEEDIEDEELDAEVEEDEDEEPAPKARRSTKKKAAAPAKTNGKATDKETLGSAWLKEHVNDTLGTDHESTKLRIVLRKLIKDEVIESPKDGRYIFTGPRDPNVKAVIAALRDEAKAGPAKRGRKPKSKVTDEVEDAEDEVEDLDLEDED
jgi:hypothetical protein